MMLQKEEVQHQSINAWHAWKKLWLKNCEENKAIPREPLSKYVNKLKDKILVQAAFGYSLSQNLETLKKYRDDIYLECCDKAFGYLMKNGIVPDFCIVVDASVSAEWIDGQDTSKTTLFACAAAQPQWIKLWKGPVVFHVNWDNIGTAHPISKASGVYDVIPASSNVSNSQIVHAAQVLNPAIQMLVGYDFSWRDDGLYYASKDSDKRHWMKHTDAISPFGYIAHTSSNLAFSCRWLAQFIFRYKQCKIINCSGEGLLELEFMMPLGVAIEKYRGKHGRKIICHQ